MDENEEDGLKVLEEGLKNEINELKSQIEENELVHGIPSKGMSSIYVPKDPDHFRRLRRLVLQRTMNVAEERPLKIQAEVMMEELKSCDKREYSYKSIPLLIHQYFLDTIQECVAAKHAHLLRWKRYCITTSIAESIYPEYKDRVEHIMQEYLDASSRAHRLSATQEGCLNSSELGIEDLTVDDMVIYLRWLISHLYSLKYVTQLSRVIQWFPIAHWKQMQNIMDVDIEKIVSTNYGETDQFPDQISHSTRQYGGASSGYRSDNNAPVTFSDAVPTPPTLIASLFVSSRPLKPTEFHQSLAAAGGGIVTDETSLKLPLHTNDIKYLRPHLVVFSHVYGIDMDVNGIKSSADEMELYSLVNRKFKAHFNLQDQQRTFRAYEAPEVVQEKWGLESCNKALKKPVNWLKYVHIQPVRDLTVVRVMSQLRSIGKIDELLKSTDRFLSLPNYERVQDALRHHALMVQHPPVVHSAAVIAHRQGISIAEIFKKIYTNPELYNPKYKKKADGTLEDTHDTYEFTQTMQMLGLDDRNDTKDDPSSVQGAYLSYLHLRHMKIRDLQRTCMSVLNYFRSIERTITINDQGLSLDGGVGDRSYQNHRAGTYPGHQGGGGNIGSHGYLFNTPREFRINETEFMQFAEVENHDDFYFHEEGRIHVRDQAGYWIMYDAAIDDFETLRQDLLLIATSFLNKDKELREASLFNRKKRTRDEAQGDPDIKQFAHREVDRFGVLFDIWSNHTLFLESKKKVMDILMEAYQNTFNREEKRLLAQEMTNLIWCQPRIDLEAAYFVATYRIECAIMRLKCDMYRGIMNTQIDRQREYLQMLGENIQDFGIPLPVVQKLPIAVNADESALKNIYLLEFHPSLSLISRITVCVNWSYRELLQMIRPDTVSRAILLEKRMLELLQLEIDSMEQLGISYTPVIQRDVFSGYFVENPIMMTQLADEYLKIIDARNTRGDKKSRKMKLLDEFGRLFELVTTRFRLIDAAWDSEVLAKVYQRQATTLGYDDFHLYMRPVQFEGAKKKEGAETARPPLYASSVQDDDTILDKFTPSAFTLAINELDEVTMGKFSFRGRAQVMEVLEGRGIENLLTVLKAQLLHKNALVAAVTLCSVCRPSIYLHKLAGSSEESQESTQQHSSSGGKMDNRSEISTTNTTNVSTYNLPVSSQAGPTPLALDTKRADDFQLKDVHPEAFFSIQLEKTPSRDRTMNLYVKKFGAGTKPTLQETEKVKRDLVHQFCVDFGERVQHASLRAQIIANFNSIIQLLHLVPEVATKFFQFGDVFEKKVASIDNQNNLQTNPRTLRRRARRIFSENGSKFINLWFIPHFTEILFFLRAGSTSTTMDDAEITACLNRLARLTCSFHDLLQLMIGISRLGINCARVSTEMKQANAAGNENGEAGEQDEVGSGGKKTSSSLESLKKGKSSSTIHSQWNMKDIAYETDSNASRLLDQLVDGMEINRKRDYDGGIMSQMSTDLIEIEHQIAGLSDPTSVDQVVDLIIHRRNISLLKFEYCIRNVLLETFLSNENVHAYQAVSSNMDHAIENLTNVMKPCCYSMKLNIPEPLEPIDERSKELFPFRTIINKYGPFLIMHDLQLNIQESIQICLAGLDPVDRPIVHGEFLSLDLTLQEVLSVGEISEMKAGRKLLIEEFEGIPMLARKFHKKDRQITSASASATTTPIPSEGGGSLDIITQANRCYKLIKKFIIICKRLDILKYHWGSRKFGVESIDSPETFKMFCNIYKTEKLYPLIKSLCIQYRMPELAQQGPLADTDVYVAPKGIPDIVVRQRQLGKMIETFEIMMIGDLRKRIIRQIDMVIKERNREEGNLPLDLWKRPAMKEAISVKRPNIAEDFVEHLMSKDDSTLITNTEITFDREHLNLCLQNLGISVLQAQRESYENYAMYYENQLKHQHQLLYGREREIEDLKQQIQLKDLATTVSVQFQLADQAHSLLLEVNALRAKVNEMQEDSLQQEKMIRDEVRQEYNRMVQNLFSVAFEQKNQIDVYREYLHDATLKRIQEVRTEAAVEMNQVKEKSGAKVTADDELAERNLKLSHDLTRLQQDNIHIRQMMSRMKSVFNWHHTFLRCNFQKEIAKMSQERDKYKHGVTRIQMKADQKVQLLAEELQRMKQYLTGTERELNDLRKTLDKEMKEKMEKKHASERKAATDRQLALVKQMHIDQLMSEITEKNGKICNMSKVLTENIKSHKSVTDKSAREVGLLKKTLREERRLKQNAFNKVDDLVGQVYEFEAAFALVKSGGGPNSSQATDSISCNMVIGGPGQQRPLSTIGQRGTLSSAKRNLEPLTNRPRPVTYGDILRRYPIPFTPDHYQEFRNDKVGGQALRKRIADQLILNLQPESHDTLASAAALSSPHTTATTTADGGRGANSIMPKHGSATGTL